MTAKGYTSPYFMRYKQAAALGAQVLASDKKFIFVAAAHAQRACDFLWGLQPAAAQQAA